MHRLLEGLGTMVFAIVVFIILANFASPKILSGTDTGSTLLKSIYLLIVAGVTIVVPLFVLVKVWKSNDNE